MQKAAWAWCCCWLLALTMLASDQCGAQDTSSCTTQLVPCLKYLNSTSGLPSSDCCDPLTSVIKSNPQCLCNLLTSNTGSSSGINITQALLLPSKCGVNVNAATCSASSSPNSTLNPKSNSGSRFSIDSMLLTAMILPFIIQVSWA